MMMLNVKGLIGVVFCVVSFASQANFKISDTLLKRVQQAQQKLDQCQQRINTEHQQIADQIQQKLIAIKALRKQAADIQRAKDEQLIGITELQNRVKQWQEQSVYQNQLLRSFSDQTGLQLADKDNNIDLKKIKHHLQMQLSPKWQTEQLVNAQNQLTEFNTLAIGPISFAYNQQQAGLVKKKINQAVPSLAVLPIENNLAQQLDQLHVTGQASIYLDPTLGNADKLSDQHQNFRQYIEKGGTWTYPILLFAVAAVLIALFKAVQLIRLPKIDLNLAQQCNELIKSKQQNKLAQLIKQLPNVQAQLVETVISIDVSQKRDDHLVDILKLQKHQNEKYLGVITTCAAVAPLLGLLGTVSGMIHTFMMMNIFGSGDAAVVSGGISQALITTELGLIVAIPALILSALLNRFVKSYDNQLERLAIALSQTEKPAFEAEELPC